MAKMQADQILEALYPYFSKEVQAKFWTADETEKTGRTP